MMIQKGGNGRSPGPARADSHWLSACSYLRHVPVTHRRQFYLRLLSVDPAPPVALDAFFTLRFTRPSATNDWTCYALRALEHAAAKRGMTESSADGGRFDVRRRCEARWRAWVGG